MRKGLLLSTSQVGALLSVLITRLGGWWRRRRRRRRRGRGVGREWEIIYKFIINSYNLYADNITFSRALLRENI